MMVVVQHRDVASTLILMALVALHPLGVQRCINRHVGNFLHSHS